MSDIFHRFARATSQLVGSAWMFVAALAMLFIWAITGPLFAYSDTWQLVINTTTSVVTFLVVFLIQNTQNRDSRAMHLKLDELLYALKEARTRLVNLENMSEEEVEAIQKQFDRLGKVAATEPLGLSSAADEPQPDADQPQVSSKEDVASNAAV
ncbi:MAG TPA: low affinity iron permease family protein [Pirellulales bacterium]|jgi:low affinity Fe/Cu permease|nr:low affinity iron permease family protein [Pirellulales bacterium]